MSPRDAKPRYVVLVKPPDDHPGFVRIMGTFYDLVAAQRLCTRLRNLVEADISDEATGYAYVMRLEAPNFHSARAWVLEGRQ